MDIRLLGPLEVLADDGVALPVSAPMLRTTLAALALRTGQVVPVGELAEQLWGSQLPASARTTLRNYVMRLRKAVPGERIRTVAGGYQLYASKEETDLGRFRAILLRSRELTAKAPAEAAVMLDGAMGLWRGTPLSDLSDCPLRTVERPRLEELYLTALEERFELKLSLGEHAVIVEELAAAARAHHLRERLTRQLMLALYRCGRTAEALAAYREARARLIEALGIEPGTELRQLERSILRGDPRLVNVIRPRGGSPGSSGPWVAGASRGREGRRATAAFPAGTATFVARGVELARLRGWLTNTVAAPAICLIDGQGGVGKSTLAVRAAREVADRFPDGLLRVDLRGADPRNPPLDATEALHQLLTTLGTDPADIPQTPERAAALYHEQLADRRVLIFLDNALDIRQIEPLLPTEPGVAALVTSRTALTGAASGHHLHLETLDPPDAVALVQSIAGGSAGRGGESDWEELVALCGHLPLALRIIATRMARRPRWSVKDWTALLRDERGRMDELRVDDLDLRSSLMVGTDQLAGSEDPADRLAAAMLPLLGTAAVPSYSPSSVAAVVGCTSREAGEALERLTDARIVDSLRPGVYTLHDMVRASAVWQASRLPRERARAHLGDLAGWYLGSLYRVNVPLALPSRQRGRYQEGADRFPSGRLFTTVGESLPWADEALTDVLSLSRQLSAPEYDDGRELGDRSLSRFPLEAVRALESYFGMRLSWRVQERLCQLALSVAERTGDTFGRAVALAQLGKAAGQRGDGSQGADLAARGEALFRSLGDQDEALGVRNNVVACLAAAGRFDEAVASAQRALEEAQGPEREELRVSLRNNLGRCYLHLGRHEEAGRLLGDNYRAARLPYARTMAACILAEYHLTIREFEEAARWADRGLGHAAEQPFDPHTVALQRTWLAAALRGMGREDQARAEETQAQAVLEDLNHRENSHLQLRTPAASPCEVRPTLEA